MNDIEQWVARFRLCSNHASCLSACPEAVLAADLFNKTGRRRGSRFDCLIAATAILAQAEIATVNQSDFSAFTAHGLKLANPPPPRHRRQLPEADS